MTATAYDLQRVLSCDDDIVNQLGIFGYAAHTDVQQSNSINITSHINNNTINNKPSPSPPPGPPPPLYRNNKPHILSFSQTQTDTDSLPDIIIQKLISAESQSQSPSPTNVSHIPDFSEENNKNNKFKTLTKINSAQIPHQKSVCKVKENKSYDMNSCDQNKDSSVCCCHTNRESVTQEQNEQKKCTRPVASDCIDIDKCLSFKRILQFLTFYQKYNIDNICGRNEQLLRCISNDISSIIVAYHHILDQHLNEDNINSVETNQAFKNIYKHLMKTNDIKCDINSCKIYKRNMRMREKESINCSDKQICMKIDLLDTIHCYFMHSVDTGYRILNNDELKPLNFKQIHEKCRGNSRCSYNKFTTNIDIKTDDIDSEEDEQTDKQDIEYSFGQRYDYWNKKDKDYVVCKYKASFKHEIINNKIFCIDRNKFDQFYQESQLLIDTSEKIRSIRSSEVRDDRYKIKNGLPLKVDNIISLKLYTDCDILSFNFTKTFRTKSKNETLNDMKERNSEYWWWSKILTETVNCYGVKMKDTNINVFYHGISKLYFDKFTTTFVSPTSVTTKLQIATIFAKNNGIILELKRCSHYVRCGDLRYFNCCFVSCFGNENERLFINPPHPYRLEINSIRDMSTNENHKEYIQSIKILNKILWGHDVVDIEKSVKVKICNLLNYSIHNNKNTNDCPLYVLKTFEKWAQNKTDTIYINMNDMRNYYDFLSDILVSNGNLLSFHKINAVFTEIKEINCLKTGVISTSYLSSLLNILDEINNLQCSKVNKIYLNDVLNVSSLSMTISKYISKFEQRNWTCKLYEDSDKHDFLLLLRCVN